jgi:hypothetical protein
MDLHDLADALRRRPLLLAHPFVWDQIRHLYGVSRDAQTLPGELRIALVDQETEATAREELAKLITAWTRGLVLGWNVDIYRPKRRGRPSRFDPPRDVDDRGRYEAESRFAFCDECADWFTALNDRSRFRWRKLSAEYRDDPEDTVEQLLPSVLQLYRARFAKHLAYLFPDDTRAQLTDFSPGPLKKLIRDGFKRRSPHEHITYGLAGYPYGWTADEVRGIVERSGGISRFIR